MSSDKHSSGEQEEQGDELEADSGGASLARSAPADPGQPYILALASPEVVDSVRHVLAGTSSGETFRFHSVAHVNELYDALRTKPTVVILFDSQSQLPVVRSLKDDDEFQDVPVLFILPTADRALMLEAAQCGCDDIVLVGTDQSELHDRLEAIWRYHQTYGFAPPSGHWYAFSLNEDGGDSSGPGSDQVPILHSEQRFAAGPKGAAHILLVSDHPYYKLKGQELLTRAGHSVSFVDSGFLAMQFLHNLARGTAPTTPAFLQGKLDLIIIAMGVSNATSAQLIRQIKESADYRTVPVLMISDSAEGQEHIVPFMRDGVFVAVDPQPQPEDLAFRIFEILLDTEGSPRQASRYRYATPCMYRNRQSPAGDWRFCLTYNLNHQSIYVRTINPPARGEEVEMKFRLSEEGFLLEFVGPVVWSNPWRPTSRQAYPAGFGVALRAANASHFEALRDFCDVLHESGAAALRVYQT